MKTNILVAVFLGLFSGTVFSKDITPVGSVLFGGFYKNGTVQVFSDHNCSHCQAFFPNISEINLAGYNVEYIPFPISNKSKEEMNSMLCLPNDVYQKMFIKKYKYAEVPIKPNADCNISIEPNIRLAIQLHISSTPSFRIWNETKIVTGFYTVDSLLNDLKGKQ